MQHMTNKLLEYVMFPSKLGVFRQYNLAIIEILPLIIVNREYRVSLKSIFNSNTYASLII